MVNHGVNNSLRRTVHVDVSRYLDSMAGYNMSLEVLQDTKTVLLRYSKQTVFFVKILSTHKWLKSQYVFCLPLNCLLSSRCTQELCMLYR